MYDSLATYAFKLVLSNWSIESTHTLVPGVDNSNKWVVLCSGNKGWMNYGDQAIVYRAYHLFRSYGIPEDHIIVFHYDDIAYNSENPTPGVVINEIGGPNVYKGVPKDYTGEDVNPKNNRFAKLSIYVDTCYSGSMFNKILPDNINVYATSSSNPTELSWFWNYDDKLRTYISSFFANNWLVNDEENDLDKETLQKQFEYFKQHSVVNYTKDHTTHPIHAQQYGDLSISKLTVSQFLGHKPKGQTNTVTKWEQNNDAVNKWDVSLDLLQRRIDETEDIDEKNGYLQELENLYKGRQYVDNHMTEYVNSIQHLMPNIATNAILHTKQELNNRHCYRQLVDTFHENCFDLTKNFLAVLKGNETLEKSGKKVVKSGPNDHVFVYLMDHGGHRSMFDKLLPTDINVYAITATKPDELGWFCYHDAKVYKTYLATFFAVNWLVDSEGHDPKVESLEQQYEYIKAKNNFTMDGTVHTQHAQQYGDLSIANLHLSEFLGTKKSSRMHMNSLPLDMNGQEFVSFRDVAIRVLEKNIESTDNISLKLGYIISNDF
ncbi:unnamed protein product [Oppiella nova]|uniref:Legumain n=1 Tax=Oppiella nova TaxID=334625 RepID=A0A7R9LG76_9ACAR|nr:unnamed protein product [Oppiella nova]CAG2163272.1 unnamed protein product [Oppiella nova]